MPTDRLALEDALDRAEYAAIDSFCAGHHGTADLPQLADFLRKRFDLPLVLDPDVVKGFTKDSSNLPGCAQALCRPRSECETAAILRACFRAGILCTVSAGRSNLTGSATPPDGIVISTAQMLSPEPRIDASARTVSAPVGMILEDLRRRVLELTDNRSIFPVDPTSRADATVGGAVACNASGFTPGEVGAIRSWVESVDFLFPDGYKVVARRGEYVSRDGRFVLAYGDNLREFPVPLHPRPPVKNAGGPYSSPTGVLDFVDLVVGSEGIFGFVTACTLRLAPRPVDHIDLFFSLPKEGDAVRFLGYIRRRLGGALGRLTALEYFGPNCRRFMDHEERLFHGPDQVAIYVQVPLSGSSSDAVEEWLGILTEADCGIDGDGILLIDNDRDRAIFLEARHSLPANSLEVVQQRGTFTILTDTVVPPERFAEFLDYTHGLLRAERLDYLAFGHLGDCHLHFAILPEKEQLVRAAEVYDMIVVKSAELGGVYSGEHGTGKRKRNDFLKCYGPAAVERLRSCKAAVDPRFLLNRGNVVE